MKKLILLLIVIVAFAFAGCGSSSEPEPAVEYDTAGGFHAEVYEDCPVEYASAASSAIPQIVPGADTSEMAPQNFIITKYDNGMSSMSFQKVKMDGHEFGGEIYLELDGDDYKVHYLQIANKEYLNDGIDLSQYDEK